MLSQKRNNPAADFIIVGQGLAGSVLALSLIKEGYSVSVINQPHLSSSSRIAAGIWNPIVFKRLTKSWLADDLIPELISFYEYWEKEFGISFINHRHIIKPFTEEQEKNLWLKKSHDPESENVFLDPVIYEDLQIDEHYTVKQYSKVLQAGNLDVSLFLDRTKNYFKENQNYLEEEFDFDHLKINENDIIYKELTAKNIIFCEGHLVSNNPYFNWVPMKPAKGETITIHSTKLKLKENIFNKGFFILPLGNDFFKIGATYEWNELNDVPTEKGKLELIKKLNSIITSPYKIISHEAGVRPAVTDRRPVVGKHPDIKNMYVFNGLGTKAVMLAPYFAKQLVNSIKYNLAIDVEVDPTRFIKKV
ncbi:MAG: FAD-binding oxidoreductase [Burkholderiales bacterium]|nr:FAD-binding oxidoreductase [Bacteroidia bacterium]